MCGITAYIGCQSALRLLVEGLKRMEYRGYDSAGVAIRTSEDSSCEKPITVIKKKGKVATLEAACDSDRMNGTMGIGHTRWATHGPPNDVNAHPHMSMDGKVYVVHNGIIENFSALKQALSSEGITCTSDTDTELLAHLTAQQFVLDPACSPENAVARAISAVEGTYGAVFMFTDHPDLLIGVRRGSPLIVGVKDGEYFLASDASAIVEHTKEVVYVRENEMVILRRSGFSLHALSSDAVGAASRSAAAAIEKLTLTLEQIEKGEYKHFMLKEIMEQPKVMRNCMAGRVNAESNTVHLGGIADHIERISQSSRIIICACGTSFHSGLIGEYLIEGLARINVEVEYASEFHYRNPVMTEKDVVILISQSGETADTLSAMRHAQSKGALTIGLVNVVGSSIARETDCGVYLHVGPEIGVASTKAFTGQTMVLYMMAVMLAQRRGLLSDEQMQVHIRTMVDLPDLMHRVLTENSEVVQTLARTFRFAQSFLFLGRGLNFPVALEGALKLKEISYIHAEGYAAAEMKHGPIALIDEFMPVVFVAPGSDPVFDKIRTNIEEVVARRGLVVAITTPGTDNLAEKCEALLYVPEVNEWAMPLLTVLPMQLLSYHIADLRKCDVDQPRNLAKSVTVE